MNNFKIPLRYGVIGALVMCIFSFISYLFYRQLFSSFYTQIGVGTVSLAIMIAIPLMGGFAFRKDRGNVLSFKDALVGVLLICVITFAGSSLMGYLIPNVIDTEYPEQVMQLMKNSTQETMEKFGSSDEEIEKAMERFDDEQFKPSLLQTIKGYGISLGIALVLSLIIAAVIRREPQPLIASADSDSVS